MIEVEKKFKPIEEQLNSLIKDAEYMGEKNLHDLYYDYPDYRLYKNETKLRLRNGKFELKIGDDEIAGVAQEIETDEEIQKFFNIQKPLQQFISEDLVEVINYNTKRKKYKKDGFNIDIDELDFGFSCVEIEYIVEKESEVETAKQKIIDFAKKHNIKAELISSKRKEYFRIKKPEIYQKLYPEG